MVRDGAPGETGKEWVVKVHCDEGVAIHIGPEPCVATREGNREASVGERVGRLLSRERTYPGCRRCRLGGKQHGRARHCECPNGPAWSLEPGMHGRSLRGNREIPWLTGSWYLPARIGKVRNRSR